MNTQDEVRDLMARASALPYGRGRSQLWAEAASLAESAGLEGLALKANLALVAAYAHGGESSKLLAPFVWCNAMYGRRPDLFTAAMVHSLGWGYKYVVDTLRCFPAVSRDQCLEILEEMRRHYLSRGDSMRAYHIHEYKLYRDLGEKDAADEAFRRWRSSGPSDLADCAGCDPQYEISYFSDRGDWQAACRVGDRALADKGRYCFQQPDLLLTRMLEPWLRTGRDAEAWAGHVRAYRRYQTDPTRLASIGLHIDYLRLCGTPERLERGRGILVRHLPWWEHADSPRTLMDTAICAARLIRELPGERGVERLHAKLPGEKLSWAPRQTLTNPTLAEAEEWFTDLALELADGYDRRPGILGPYMVEEVRARLHSPGLDRPLRRNAIPDVSGMMAPDTQDYRVVDASAVFSGASPEARRRESPVEGEEKARGVRAEGGGLRAGDGSAAPEASVDSSDSAHASEVEPPLVPIDVDGPWRTMGLSELLEAAARLGPSVEGVCLLRAAQILCDDPDSPSSVEEVGPDGDTWQFARQERTREWARYEEAWRRARNLADSFLTGDPSASEAPEADPLAPAAFRLMARARELAEQNDFRGACLAADEAMRTVSPDPLGVRLEALKILSSMSAAAGYLEEAMEYARGLVNLSAACGLAFVNAAASHELANLLLRTRRPVEAAEVAQLALLRMEAYPHSPLALQLHASLAKALTTLDDDGAIAHAAVELADLLEIRGDTLGARDCYSRAAEAFKEVGDPGRSLALWAHALRLTEEADTQVQVANVLSNYAHAIATQPGRLSEDQIDLMDRLMERRRALLASSEEETEVRNWLDADWLRTMGLFSWYAMRRRLAEDYARAAVDAFAALGQPIDQARTLALLARMSLSTGEFDEADTFLDEGESLLREPRFRGHELLLELASLRADVRQAREERESR